MKALRLFDDFLKGSTKIAMPQSSRLGYFINHPPIFGDSFIIDNSRSGICFVPAVILDMLPEFGGVFWVCLHMQFVDNI